ncbi:MAG: DinB family protein [Gemmatimonadaceae bacterium]
MHPRIAELVSFIEGERRGVESALAAVPEPWRQRRPSAGSWSAAEVVDHLARVEQGVARVVERRTAGALEAGLGAETSVESVLGTLDHEKIAGPGKLTAPELVRPDPDVDAAGAVAALAESRMLLRSALLEADGLALGEVTQTDPLLGELNLYQWVLFVGLHERRHLRQLRALADWSRAAADGTDTERAAITETNDD